MTLESVTAVRRSLLRLDRVLLVCLAILAGLALIAPDQAQTHDRRGGDG